MAESAWDDDLEMAKFPAVATDRLAAETIELVEHERRLTPLPSYSAEKTPKGVRLRMETWHGVQIVEYSDRLLDFMRERRGDPEEGQP